MMEMATTQCAYTYNEIKTYAIAFYFDIQWHNASTTNGDKDDDDQLIFNDGKEPETSYVAYRRCCRCFA